MIIHQTKKWNISLIMLFVLAIGSLIGLMSTNFIQDMIKSSLSLRDFYQSYYLSKGGIELWILAVEKYDYGFEDTLSGSEDIIKNNLHCKKDCNLFIDIKSRTRPNTFDEKFWKTPTLFNSCSLVSNPEHIITLSWWESYIIPLFADHKKLSNNSNTIDFINLLKNDYKLEIIPESSSYNENHSIGIGIALWSWFRNETYENQPITGKQELYITWHWENISIRKLLYDTKSILWEILQTEQSIVRRFNSDSDLLEKENFNYLFITNIETNNYSFCFKADPKIEWYALDNAIITSIWSYWETTIWLQANIKKPLPEYIINSYSTYE